eukprot:SAG25_NODE_3699_length_994_cov_1.475978_1_plen_54_part_10
MYVCMYVCMTMYVCMWGTQQQLPFSPGPVLPGGELSPKSGPQLHDRGDRAPPYI